MKNIGIIVGSVPLGMELSVLNDIINSNTRENTYIIAADGGLDNLLEAGIQPDEWVGDMDSTRIDRISEHIPVKKVSPIKDETDMELALKLIAGWECKTIYIFGGTGGKRIEHTFANIQLMHNYAKKGIRIYMVSNECTMFVLTKGFVSLGAKDAGYVSVFSLTDISENVSIKGLFYEYEGNLVNTNALGVSNEYVGKEAVISVENGALLIVTENDYNDRRDK